MFKKAFKNFYLIALLFLVAGGILFLPQHKTARAEELKAEQSSNWSESFNGVSSYELGSSKLYDNDVLQISSATDLAFVADQVNKGVYNSKNFVLTADIDLAGSLWTPIGTNSYPFTGIFYGEGHKISNISINEYSCDASSTNSGAGLFGNLSGAKICDLTLSGWQQNHANSTRAKGTLAGKISNGTYILNCYDKTINAIDQSGNDIESIGNSTSNDYIFRGGDVNGSEITYTANYNTKDLIDNTITDSSGNAKSGYVLHYNANGGAFMVGDVGWYNTNLAKVLLTFDGNKFVEYGTNIANIYLGNLPVHRATAVENFNQNQTYSIYWFKEGYKATFVDLTSLNFSYGLLSNMSSANATISVTLNHKYGTRTGTYTFNYDQSFASFFTANDYVKNRAGYTFNGLFYSESYQMDDDTVFSLNETDSEHENSFKDCFPIAGEEYYFKWTANDGITINVKFAIASDEGGKFGSEISVQQAVKSIQTSWVDSRYDQFGNSANYSGQHAILLKLNPGFRLKESITPNTNGEDISATEDSAYGDPYYNTSNYTSGAYVKFASHTDKGENYSYNGKNNDDYSPVSVDVKHSGESDEINTYAVAINNVCGTNGEVWFVIERQWIEVDMTIEADDRYPINYNWTLTDVVTKWESEASTQGDSTKTLLVRRGEKAEIQLEVTTESMYVLSREPGTGLTLEESSNSVTTTYDNVTKYYKKFAFYPIDSNSNKLEHDNSVKFFLGPLETRVSVKLLNEDGTDFTQTTAVGVYINDDNMEKGAVLSIDSVDVAILPSTLISVKSNGYYQAKYVSILKTGNTIPSNFDFGTSVEDENLRKVSAGPVLVEPYINGTIGVNYEIKIYFEKRQYNVDFEFYFGGVQVAKTQASGYDKIGNVITEISQKIEGKLPASVINGKFSLTDIGLGALYFKNIKVLSISNSKSVTQNRDGFVLSTPNPIEDDLVSVSDGTYNFNFTLGTYNTQVQIYLDYKMVEFTVDSLFNDETILKLSDTVTGSEKHGENLNALLKFNYEDDKGLSLNNVELSGQIYVVKNLASISLHTQYYLLGWYIKDGEFTATNVAGYMYFLSDANFVETIAKAGKNSEETTFAYTKVSAYVGLRKVNLKYAPGSADKGKIYLANKTTEAKPDERISAGTVIYNQSITLSNQIFFNLGYKFKEYTASFGAFDSINNLLYSISGGSGENSWSQLFDSSSSVYKSWNGTISSSDIQALKEVILVTNWEIIVYEVLVDGINTTKLSIGENIYYTTNQDEKIGKSIYYFDSDNVDTNGALRNIGGAIRNGYVATGYEIIHDEDKKIESPVKNYGAYNNTYQLTPENFLKFIQSDYRFEVNTNNPILINTLRDPAKYLLILDTNLANKDNEYFSYEWLEENDANSYGQVEDGVISINVTFDAIPQNLTLAVSSGALKVTRKGYSLAGWAHSNNGIQTKVFAQSSEYTIPADTHIVPIWKLEDSSYSSYLEFDENIDTSSTPKFYLEKSKDVLYGSYSGGDVTDLDYITDNGEKVVDYYFEIYFNGALISTISKQDVYNYDLFTSAGEYSVYFKVKLQDTLNKVAVAESYTVTSLVRKYILEKNTIYFFAHDLHTIYNGTSEFIPNTIAQAGYDNTFGSFLYKYDWDGSLLSDQDVKEKIGDTDTWFKDYVVIDNSTAKTFNAGSGKTLQMTLKNIDGYFGNRDLSQIFSNVTKQLDGSYTTEILGGLTIDKARFTISFPNGSAYYIDGVQTLVYDNEQNYIFTYGNVTFEYTYDKLMLVENAQPGKYQGTGFNHNVDAQSFTFVDDKDFVIKNHIDDRDTNFEWVISSESIFTLMDSSSALKFDYSSKYISASNGQLDQVLSNSFDGKTETMSIANVYVDGVKVQIPELEQYSVYADTDVILFIAGINSERIYTYINKSALSSHTLSFDIVINVSSDRDDTLKTLIWTKSDSSISTIESGFTSLSDYRTNVIPVYADVNSSFYAVLTDVVKVNIDYNTGKNDEGKSSEVVYVSSTSSVEIANPTHDYIGLAFNGYLQEQSSNISLKDNASSKTFSTTNGGKSETIKAKWNFISIDATLVKEKHEYLASREGLELNLSSIATIILPDGVTSSAYSLSSGEENYNYLVSTGKFVIADERGFLAPSMSGEYTLSLTIVYSDGIQSPQTQTLDLDFEIEISINTIEFVYKDGNRTFNNKNQESAIDIAYMLNGEKQSDVKLSQISRGDNTLSVYNSYLTIKNSANQKADMFNADTYTLTFTIDSDLVELYKIADGKDNFTIIIEKYTIVLTDYSEEIASQLYKVFGQKEPDPIKAQVVIADNLNDEVEISFSRENKSDAINEEGYPVVCTGVIGEDSTNYAIDDSGSSFTFKILSPSQNLQIELEASFTYTYNGYPLTTFAITYDGENDKYILTGKAGSESFNINFAIYYVVNENKIEIPEEQKEQYTQEIIFSSSAQANIGKYDFTVSLAEGSSWTGVDIVNPALAKIEVVKRDLTITKVEKVFDRNKTILASGVEFDNIITGDQVLLNGLYASEFAGENITLNNLSISGAKAGNYILKNPEFKGRITKAQVDEITFDLNKKTFNYGLLKDSTALGDFFALSEGYTFANGEENDIRSGYIQISSFKVANTALSTGKYINAGNIQVSFILTSSNFDGLSANGYVVEIKVNQYTLDLSAIQISKEYNENALLPENLNTSLEGYILAGDVASIDLTKGGYDDKEIGEDKHVTIVLTGKDSANYAVIDNLTGKITPYQITLNVIADREHSDLVTDGKFVDDGLTPVVKESVFYLEYPSYSPEQAIASLTLPERKGYNAVGWKFYDEENDTYILITKDNLNDIFKEISEDDIPENSLDIFAVWEIQVYTINIESSNIENCELTATDNKINYYSSFTMDVESVRGFKIINVNIAQGKVGSATLGDIGKRSGSFAFNKVESDLKIVITTQVLNVTFEVKLNIPQHTKRADSNNLTQAFGYTTLKLLTEEDLPQVKVTNGTYAFSGYTYGSENTLIGDKTLQAVVDELYPDDQLVTDVKILINATWTGENYIIKFNPNGGTLEGVSEISAVYGSVIQDAFPTCSLPGRSYKWTCNNIDYIDGDVLRSVGEQVEDVWTVTFTATWTNNPYTLIVKFDEKLNVFANNAPISSESEFEIVYSEDKVDFLIRPNTGYVFSYDVTTLNGQYTENGNIISVYNLIDDGEIIFSSVPDDNTLTINADSNVSQIDGYLVTADGDTALEITENKLIAKTESTVKVILTAKKGWIFSENSITFAGNGTFTKEISQDKKTMTVIWSEFIDDGSITVKPDPDDNKVVTGDLTAIFESLSFNGQSVDLTGNTYIIKTATPLNIIGVLKYGYMDGGVSTGENDYVREGSVNNVFSATDRHYHFSAVVENFDEGFTLTFTNAPRIFKFSLAIREGDEIYGEITSNPNQSVNFGEELVLTQDELLPTYMFDKWLYHNGKVLNDIPNQSIILNSSCKDLLECVSEGETINIVASYKRKVVSMTFSASGKGSYTISQTVDNVFHKIENAYALTTEIYMGQYLDFVISPVSGYEIDKTLFDNVEINPEDYGYNVTDGRMKVFIDLENPIKEIAISFKASVANVYVQAGTRVNYTDYLGTTAGGYIYLTDSQGNKLGEELYLAGKGGSVLVGGDYSISTFTDETLCFIIEARSGFTQAVSASAGIVINQYIVGELTVYAFANVRNLSEILVLFTAKENVVNVKFALDGESELAHAGIIEADTSSNYVSAIPYRGDNVSISIITGADLVLEVNSSLAYSLVADELGKIKYSIIYKDDSSFEDNQISVGEIYDRDSLKTGYTNSANFTISGVNTNATIIFYVTPREYTIKFNVFDVTSATMQAKVRYGEEWSTDLLTEEERATVFATRTGYSFLGYFTAPNGQGTQYIDKDGKVVSRWLEDGYFYNGSSYEVEGNFDATTDTYTLYANWLYNRADVTIEFVPGEVGNIERSYNIAHVITNLNSLSSWTSQDNRWYAEIIIGATLQIKAIEFDGYVFDSWIVSFQGGEGVTKPASFNLEKIETGSYKIKAVYRPKYELNVINENNALTDGGSIKALQDGQELSSGSIDSQMNLTLRATPNEGYKFLYFVDNNTAQKIYGTIDENGIGSYTYTNLITKPISVTAVFTGKPISVNLDSKEIQTHHELIAVRVNGRVVDYTKIITAQVGDTITLEIKKKQGYNFSVTGANFTNSVNSAGNYVFSYTFSLDGLVPSGDGYSIDIKFSAPREKIRFAFDIVLDDAYNEVEEGKSGSLLLINNDASLSNVKLGEVYTYLYGEQFMLKISTNENYELKRVYLFTTDMIYNISDRVVDGVLVVDAILMDIYFDYEIKINAYFERLVWTDVRAARFEGKGSEDNPYIISNAKEFALLAYLVNNGVENFENVLYSECHFVVTKNIDFEGRYFEPIGTEENPFNGTINLGSHEFTNVSHYRDYKNPNTSYSGLFWHLGRNAKIIAEKASFVILIVVIVVVVIAIGLTIFLIFFFRKRKKKQLEQLANQ